MKYTPQTLKKIETLFRTLGYHIRSGKGNFNTGCCLLSDKKVVVMNNFHTIEAKINALSDLLQGIAVDVEQLSDEDRKDYTIFTGLVKTKPNATLEMSQ